MRPLTLLLLCGLIGAAHGQDPAASWETRCTSGNDAFRLTFRSASLDAYNDDMTVTLLASDGRELRLPLKPALYEKRVRQLNTETRCADVLAIEIAPRRVALFFSRNARPHWNGLDIVVVDLRTLSVVSKKLDVGAIKTRDLALRKAGAASYDVRLIREELKDSGCDCPDKYIEDWMRLGFTPTQITARWMRR
jgi:hypothetical protein